MASPAVLGGAAGSSKSYSQGDRHDRRRKGKDRERFEKERVRKEHARKVLEEQKINKTRPKWQKQTEFLCNIKFRNSLPDPPLGPHFLEVPLDLEKYVTYKPTTLEQDYKWKLHYERDLGVPIDVIDPRNYLLPRKLPPLAPEDRMLLNWREGNSSTSEKKEDLSTSARRKRIDTSVTWLKKTVYLTNDPFDPVHQFKSEQQAQADKQKELEMELSRRGTVDRKNLILESFMLANSRKPLVHQDVNKRHLTAEVVMPVMPDVSLWPNTYTTIVFDKDPAGDDMVKGSEERKRKRTSEALVCNVKKTTFEGNDHEIITGSYLMPKEKSEMGDADVAYEYVKDYKFNIVHYPQTHHDGNPHLLFVIDPEEGTATYCKLSAKVELSNLPREHNSASGRGAVLSRRDLTKDEVMNARKKIATDLQLEGDYEGLDEGSVVSNYTTSNGAEVGDTAPNEEDGEALVTENSDLTGGDGANSSWNGSASDAAEHESVPSTTMESKASNMGDKGAGSSERYMTGVHTDDNDSD